MARRRSLWRSLKSRRLAVVLISASVIWSILGTIVPQTSLTSEAEVAAWDAAHPALAVIVGALGLHDAFRAPAFLAVMVILACATVACSCERTRLTLRRYRERGRITEATLDRLRKHPDFVLDVSAGMPSEKVLADVAGALSGLKLRVRQGPRLVEAASRGLGLLGSTVFHWSLAALLATVALGQLTRAEGFIGVPVGQSVRDVSASYGTLERGPLFLGHSGLDIAVGDLALEFVDEGGTARGPSPLVSVSRRGEKLAERRVYPNSPLRQGALFIHMNAVGFSVTASLETSQGLRVASTTSLLDFDASQRYGTTPGRMSASEGETRNIEITVTVPPARSAGEWLERLPADPQAIVTIGGEQPRVLRPGESVAIDPDTAFVLDRISYYARLSVVNDWSVHPIYALFLVIGVAVSLAVALPERAAWVLLVEDRGRLKLHVHVRHQRGEPHFSQRVESAVRGVVGETEAEKEES